ncbi:AAA family ATPase [Rhodococcus sp. NPDC059968]|uniref:AAA family ATPase n=1 Tax=Rhodococcus sp. NPDC059968 TaxID=3347017 RepID=UPI00366DECBD
MEGSRAESTEWHALYSPNRSVLWGALYTAEDFDNSDESDDSAETEYIDVDEDADGDVVEYFDVPETAVDAAAALDLLWVEDEQVSEDPFDPAAVLFFVPDEDTAALLDPAWLAEHGAFIVPASPDLPYLDLVERFEARGVDIAGFAPESTEPSVPGIADLTGARSLPPIPRVWLENGIIEAGAVNKLTAASGFGKTILLSDMAVNWSLGMSSLDVDEDGKPRRLNRPQRVLYIDGELGLPWWTDYTRRFRFPRHLPNFHLRTLTDDAPTWPALCTPDGAEAFLAFIREFAIAVGGLDVIVLDTLSAFVGGEESSNDTWLEFDRLVTLPLKASGITVVYADHTGHDNSRARGASAKKAKLDVEWVLDLPDKSAPDTLRLSNPVDTGKMRNGFDGHPRVVHLERRDNPLTHVRVDVTRAAKSSALDGDTDPRVLDLVVKMDAAKLPFKVTKRDAIAELRAKRKHKFDDKLVTTAIEFRENREAARLAAEETPDGGGIDAQE